MNYEHYTEVNLFDICDDVFHEKETYGNDVWSKECMNHILQLGSGISGGKERIYSFFTRYDFSLADRAKQEYIDKYISKNYGDLENKPEHEDNDKIESSQNDLTIESQQDSKKIKKIDEGYQKIYQTYIKETDAEYRKDYNAKGYSYIITYEDETQVRYLMYDRDNQEGKKAQYVYYKSTKSTDGSWNMMDADIIIDNCQDTIFGGFAPNSETAKTLSEAMGTRTVLSGSITRGKSDPSQSLQMIERPLMTPDELKGLKKGNFIVTKTGSSPMKTKLLLYSKWGITFDEPFQMEEQITRTVYYADKEIIQKAIQKKYAKQECLKMR